MAYENIDVSSLNNSLNKLDNIDYRKVNNLISSISSSEWQSPSCKRVMNALKKIVYEYEQINKEIDNLKNAANYIKSYQNLDRENNNYQSKITSTNRELRNSKDDDYMKRYLNNKVNQYNSYIRKNNVEKTNLKNKINLLIN